MSRQQDSVQECQLEPRPWGFIGHFYSMANHCEILIDSHNEAMAEAILITAMNEAKRIEVKYSRFLQHNYLWQLNHSDNPSVTIDAETHRLLCFAQQCYQLSDGQFDITAGPLMQLWRFEKGAKTPLPSDKAIQAAKAFIGFSALQFDASSLTLPKGMSLDFGGIAKEYAVDSAASLIAQRWPQVSVLVNFGGDIACPVAKTLPSQPWQVGIENPYALDQAAALLEIRQGALATSGDTRRYIKHNGKLYGHIINPFTGYPVEAAPRSVTVLAPNCLMAGMLSTMAMLQGPDAEIFLSNQGVDFKVFR
ncbi:FAD:protein FMN transferase [Shewanella sp. Isolate11]|uniref:FAD:protein FMN transferase n=1 Tax=Shewanella sp. Isolate11 TaxID=2908530 RepID=UPI001EFDCC1E|nr:FAD:protein FMN transferase [Shewanella sp. Isolate11]MCG9695378.1 FAD:protein FMN transferase [Shewanella sp. Isolate11]